MRLKNDCLTKYVSFWEKGIENFTFAWFCKVVKVDPKSQGLTRKINHMMILFYGQAVWKNTAKNHFYGQDSKIKIYNHPRKIKHIN